jgi:hypothetical protein
MSQRRLGVAGVALMTLLCLPRESAAGAGDFIWGMSGPQMLGVLAHCRVPIGAPITQCHILNRRLDKADAFADRNHWLSLEGGLYGSTHRDSDEGNEYSWFDVGMLTFEPLFEWRWPGARELHSGVGVGYNFLFGIGKDFDRFDKFNIKLRLIAVESPRADLAVNLRIYPNGFTSDEFGVGDRVDDMDRPAEAVIGFSVGFRKLWRW